VKYILGINVVGKKQRYIKIRNVLFTTQCVLCVVRTTCISVRNLYSLYIFPQQTEVISVILITKFGTCIVSTYSAL